MNTHTENFIEAILFYKAGQVSIKELSKMLSVSVTEIEASLITLKKNLENRGVQLVTNDQKVMLRTSPEASKIIEQITKEDLSKDLGKAGLETLSIVLYNYPISGRDIEYIRGVKSSYILRNLMTRGLIERSQDSLEGRSYVYKPTFETLGFLGISEISELPEYSKTKEELARFAESREENEQHNED